MKTARRRPLDLSDTIWRFPAGDPAGVPFPAWLSGANPYSAGPNKIAAMGLWRVGAHDEAGGRPAGRGPALRPAAGAPGGGAPARGQVPGGARAPRRPPEGCPARAAVP